MPHEFVPHDIALANTNVQLTLAFGTDLANNVLFQLPPKVKDDTRGGKWGEQNTGPANPEPIATYEHAMPRSITMEWAYVVGMGPGWNAARIQTQCSNLRKYFTNQQNQIAAINNGLGAVAGAGAGLIGTSVGNGIYGGVCVGLKIWGMGGAQPMSYRIDNLSIKHGDTLVGSDANLRLGSNVYALNTSISVSLRSWPIVLGVQFGVRGMQLTAPDWY